jgi:hypothetical protein
MIATKKFLLTASVLVLAAGFACSFQAYGMGESSWPTQITFLEPFQVGDLTFSAGTYKFYLTDGPITRNVVMIYNVDNSRWEGMVMGVHDMRMDTGTGSGFQFIDARDGMPQRLEYWFYPGWKRGIKFIYSDAGMASMHTALVSLKK